MKLQNTLFSKGEWGYQQVALTFDTEFWDQKDSRVEETLLEVLDQYHVTATFFVTGRWADTFPHCMQRIVAQGHEIGNHSYSHFNLTEITSSEVIKDIIAGENAIKNRVNVTTRPFFRPPYLAYNDEVLAAIGQAGFSATISASLDPRDWEMPLADEISRRILEPVVDGDIILLHSWVGNTAGAMREVIPRLKDRGLNMVSVSEILKLNIISYL